MLKKNYLNALLARLKKIGSANELFELFNLENELEEEDSKERGLLVRANPEPR